VTAGDIRDKKKKKGDTRKVTNDAADHGSELSGGDERRCRLQYDMVKSGACRDGPTLRWVGSWAFP
jgi:hypothetical protein